MAARAITPPTEEAKELARLCRTGRHYDLERIIAEGKLPEGVVVKRKTLLQIAVEKGFHSLVELIAKQEHS